MQQDIQYPAVAISTSGWHKVAYEWAGLTDASPADDLAEWHAVEIIDAGGKRFVVERAHRAWPKQRWGATLCRLFNQSVQVGFEFSSVEQLSLEEVARRVSAIESLPSAHPWSSPKEIMEFMCG